MTSTRNRVRFPPVIFINVGAVLCSPRVYIAQQHKGGLDRWIDPVAVDYLNLLCFYTRARIVVSAGWRRLMPYTHCSPDATLPRLGFLGAFHIDWRTPRIAPRRRGQEIAEWLRRHDRIKKYIILDDDESVYAPGEPLVQVDTTDGFMYSHLCLAFALLCPDEEDPICRVLRGEVFEAATDPVPPLEDAPP